MERVPDVIVKREQSRSKIRLVRTDAVTKQSRAVLTRAGDLLPDLERRKVGEFEDKA
jgi:hypothetical protein